MALIKCIACVLQKCSNYAFYLPVRMFSQCNRRQNLRVCSFMGGFALGQAYNYYLLKKIPFPYHIGAIISLLISVLIGIGNAISIQVRCISLLVFPMYCGKPGRGVLKAVILTYVVAGPITNMGLNAKEVVRVFACSTQLSYNMSKERYTVMAQPIRNTALSLTSELDRIKEALRSVRDISAPIEYEIENEDEIKEKRKENDYLDDALLGARRSEDIEMKLGPRSDDIKPTVYQKQYQKKLEYRCEHQLSQAVATCVQAFSTAYQRCYNSMPGYAAWMLCWPVKLNQVCNIMNNIKENNTCNNRNELDPGLGEGYESLKYAVKQMSGNFRDIKLQYRVTYERELFDIQDATETGERVMHAFEEKTVIMRAVLVVLNICLALLFLRIAVAAAAYHDMYLTSIGYDNVYITGYFKELDERRRRKGKITLLPLKKVERMKYIDIYSISYKALEHSKLATQMLKVMLEVVTATTFVMLDRLFFEALDVVRLYAESELTQTDHYVNIQVDGTGMLATLIRKLLNGLNSEAHSQRVYTNKRCLPKPRPMPAIYYFRIYGGYLWILTLLYINPYTLRLRRLICSYFYPRREKQRLLHLYNDILKKRMKMQKTLRRKAVQAVRAHYLSAENLLSLRMKFPQMLGWLRVLPAARMTCLICGDTQPRSDTGCQIFCHKAVMCTLLWLSVKGIVSGKETGKNPVMPSGQPRPAEWLFCKQSGTRWHSCLVPHCPFVFCDECWREAGTRCLACDPSLAELSDVDSITDDEHPAY